MFAIFIKLISMSHVIGLLLSSLHDLLKLLSF